MKKNIKNILMAGALTMMVAPMAMAQNLRTGFFLEDYTYRYRMNPAEANSDGFVAMPVLGNINVGVNGSLGLKDILYNVDGRTTTFMNPGVSASEFLSHIDDKNRFGFSVNTPVIAAGFKGMGGYNTLTLSVVGEANVKVPGSLFRLLKEGATNSTYDIGNVDAYGRAYVELALGHSRKLTSEWRVGATVKVLVGAGNVNLDMQRADLTLGTDDWTITTEGQIEANVKGLNYKTKVNENTGHRYVNDVDIDGAGVSGYGLGLDLGVVYTPHFMKELQISASLIDLGFINWNTNMVASTNGVKTFNTDKYTFNVMDDAANSFDNEFDRVKDDLSALYELSDMGDKGSKSTALGATFNIGAKYTLPMYKDLSFGLLNTSRFNGDYSWTDLRVSANWEPCRVFDAAVSAGTGTFGASFGWLLNLHTPGFNFFVGMDYVSPKFAKQGIPLSSNGGLNLGINFLF